MKTYLKNFLIFTILTFVFVASKVSYSITDTLDANIDNTLYEDEFGSYSNGKGQYFFSGKTLTERIRRGLISFKVNNQIPPGAIITDVQLVLHMSRTIADSKRIRLHKVSKDWGEGNSIPVGEEGSGTQAESGDATWIHNFYNTELWSNEGGDYSNIESGSTNVEGIGFYIWSDPQMISDVQSWVNNITPDYGWILIGDEALGATTKRFDTKDNSDLSVRPKLIVTYTFNEIALRLKSVLEGYISNTVFSAGISQTSTDTFRVFLRNSFAPYSIVDSTKAYSSAESWYVFNNAPSGSYYIMVNQRNSINTWSRLPQSFSEGSSFTNYDFTISASQAFGNNLVLKNSLYCIYSGDVNKDNFVNLTDVITVYNSASVFASGYVVTDVNGDGIVDLTDIVIAFNNSNGFVSEKRPL